MLKKILEKDEIARYLGTRTNLTKLQLDTLLISLQNTDLSLQQKIVLRDGGKVSKGSFIRTLRQAQKNLEEALFTVITLEYFTVLDENELLNLIRIGKVLKEAKTQRINSKKIQLMLRLMSTAISDICRKNY